MNNNPTNFLWVEKYRPSTIEDCILPSSLKQTFKDMVAKGEPQNLLISGTAGTGKTTIAKALCKDLKVDYIMINCSEDGNIDTLRTKIRQFGSTVSLTEDTKKVVILDEFDYSNAQSIQPALRGAIEEFSGNCRFIITCNYKSRIIEPIHSRCTCLDFVIPQPERAAVAAKMLERCEYILKQEGVAKCDRKVLAKFITKYFPDFRRVLNELQRYSASGAIDEGILVNVADLEIKNVIGFMRDKDFSSVRKWVAANVHLSHTDIFRKIYDLLVDVLSKPSIPQAILILGEYQYKAAFVADQEINMVACLVELMLSCEFN
jgi:DNA polymerase III delta prime subunit